MSPESELNLPHIYSFTMTLLTFVALLSLTLHTAISLTCYIPYSTIASTPMHQFQLPPGNQCWDYCRILDECQTFTFLLNDLSKCTLYSAGMEALKSFRGKVDLIVIGWKECLIDKATVTLSVDSDMWMEEMEVAIEKPEMGLCLDANMTDKIMIQGGAELPVFWSSECRGNARWTLITVPLEQQMGCETIILKMEQTQQCVTSVFVDEKQTEQVAILQGCERGRRDQLMVLCPDDDQGETWSIFQYLVSVCGPENSNCNMMHGLPVTLSPGEGSELVNVLLNITVKTKVDLEKEAAPCEKVAAKNGEVARLKEVPVFLPGESITVRCFPGFGVRADNYSQLYETTCSQDMNLDLCEPILQDYSNDCRSRLCMLEVVSIYLWYCIAESTE